MVMMMCLSVYKNKVANCLLMLTSRFFYDLNIISTCRVRALYFAKSSHIVLYWSSYVYNVQCSPFGAFNFHINLILCSFYSILYREGTEFRTLILRA